MRAFWAISGATPSAVPAQQPRRTGAAPQKPNFAHDSHVINHGDNKGKCTGEWPDPCQNRATPTC